MIPSSIVSYFKKNPIFDRHIRYGVLLITKQKGKSVPIFRIYTISEAPLYNVEKWWGYPCPK